MVHILPHYREREGGKEEMKEGKREESEMNQTEGKEQ